MAANYEFLWILGFLGYARVFCAEKKLGLGLYTVSKLLRDGRQLLGFIALQEAS
jgi:hypothetical protein